MLLTKLFDAICTVRHLEFSTGRTCTNLHELLRLFHVLHEVAHIGKGVVASSLRAEKRIVGSEVML